MTDFHVKYGQVSSIPDAKKKYGLYDIIISQLLLQPPWKGPTHYYKPPLHKTFILIVSRSGIDTLATVKTIPLH